MPDMVSKSAARISVASYAACHCSRALAIHRLFHDRGTGPTSAALPLHSGQPTGPSGGRDPMEQRQAPDRNLAMELVRVTEAAALAAGRSMGRGDKEAADQAAVDAMRVVLNGISMDGVVVIGEGEKDEAPMLYNGEEIGDEIGRASWRER